MPDLKSKKIAVTMDMAGCPNRCRHCWLGHMPNGKVRSDVLEEVVGKFRKWKPEGETEPYFDKIIVNTWFREPDFAPDYKELHALEERLGDEVLRFELLSVWRLARDREYAKWAADIGTKACQISFFGMEETTDFFTGRKGAFKDNLTATDRLLDAGIAPRWQFFLNERNESELEAFVGLIEGLKLEERCDEIGAKFGFFAHIPAPDGEAFDLEGSRPKEGFIGSIPEYMKKKTLEHFGTGSLDEVVGRPEKDLLPELLREDEPFGKEPPLLAFMVTPILDVYSNIGELKKWWRLGNLGAEPLDAVMERFLNDDVLGLRVNFRIPVSELARRYGRKDSEFLYTGEDLIRRWMRMYGEDNGSFSEPLPT